jgi:nitroreductase
MHMPSTVSVGRIDATSTGQRRGRVRAWSVIALGLLVAIQAVRALPRLDDMLLYGDSAIYLLLADSLASGGGYRDVAHPATPPHVHYPPGLPGALAVARLGGAKNIPAAKALLLVLGLAAGPAAYALLRPRAGTAIAGLIAVWVAVHPDYIRTATMIGSDAPYLLLSLLALLAVEASARQRGWRDWQGIAAWVASVAAALTRSVGLALIVVAPIYLAWRKAGPTWRARLGAAVLLGMCYAAPAVGWEWWKATNPSPASMSYTTLWQFRDELDWDKGKVAGLGDLIDRFVVNGRRCTRSLGGLVVGAGSDRQRTVLGLALLGLIAAGVARALRRGHWLVEAYLVIVAVGTLANPQQPLPRYLMTFLPFVLFYPALLLAAGGTAGHRSAVIAVGLALLTAVATHDVAGRERGLRPPFSEYRDAARWMADNTPPDAVIVSRKPPLSYLWSGRKSVSFPRSRNLALMDAEVRRWGVTHVVEDSFSALTGRFLGPWLGEHGDDLILVHTRGATRVWMLRGRDDADRQ